MDQPRHGTDRLDRYAKIVFEFKRWFSRCQFYLLNYELKAQECDARTDATLHKSQVHKRLRKKKLKRPLFPRTLCASMARNSIHNFTARWFRQLFYKLDDAWRFIEARFLANGKFLRRWQRRAHMLLKTMKSLGNEAK